MSKVNGIGSSKVCYTDFRCRLDEGPADKRRRLAWAAGLMNLYG